MDPVSRKNILSLDGNVTAVISIVLLSWAVYYRVFFNHFVGDDFALVVNNQLIRSWANLPKLLDPSYFGSLKEVFYGGVVSSTGEMSYRPLSTLSYMIDFSVWGPDSAGFHLTNIFLHSLNALLMYYLGRRFLRHAGAAFLAALFFTVHPINAEAVNIVSYRSDLLGCAFFLSAFLLYLRSLAPGRSWRRVLSWFCFLAALLSKENTIVLPALIFLYHRLIDPSGEPVTFGRRVRRYLPYAVVIVLYLAVWFWLKRGFGERVGLYPMDSHYSYPATLIAIVAGYIRWLVFPSFIHLTLADRSEWLASVASPQALGSALFVVSLAAAAWFGRRKYGLLAFFCAWFFLSLAPFLPCLLLRPSRYLYVPAIGFFWIFSILILKILKRFDFSKALKAMVILSIAAIFLIYFKIDVARSLVMKDRMSCANEMAAYYPKNAQARLLLASAYSDLKSWDRAIEEFKKTIDLEPPIYDLTYTGLGVAYYNKAMFAESVQAFEKALLLNPKNPMPYIWLGCIYGATNNAAEAEKYFKEAVRLDPQNTNAYFNLGIAYLKSNRIADAETVLAVAEKINEPDPMQIQKLAALKQALQEVKKSAKT